ncbi:MAG: SDR family oxidoreductase [Chitinophagaceae bacterium]|nr:SDR family oxidoreductase [Chitinophagaceae bacterium]
MKNFLLIGASSGIGRELALQLSAEGHMVWATWCHNERPNEPHINYFRFDTMNEAFNPEHLPEQLDGLVYCPGSIQLKPFARLSSEIFVNDFQLNVIGAVKVIQTVLPRLKKSDRSSVVLFSTVAVQTGMTFHASVAASKGAIEGLTRSLAAELAPAINVNCIAPSLTDTPLASGLLNTSEKQLAAAQRHPLKRIGSAEEIASLAAFLLSEKSRWMTGQIIHADGGMGSLK